jgi:hypothetical protein
MNSEYFSMNLAPFFCCLQQPVSIFAFLLHSLLFEDIRSTERSAVSLTTFMALTTELARTHVGKSFQVAGSACKKLMSTPSEHSALVEKSPTNFRVVLSPNQCSPLIGLLNHYSHHPPEAVLERCCVSYLQRHFLKTRKTT